jgi:hypothetical protein
LTEPARTRRLTAGVGKGKATDPNPAKSMIVKIPHRISCGIFTIMGWAAQRGGHPAVGRYAVTFARNADRLARFRSTFSSSVSCSCSLLLEAVNFLPRVYSEQARSPQM